MGQFNYFNYCSRYVDDSLRCSVQTLMAFWILRIACPLTLRNQVINYSN